MCGNPFKMPSIPDPPKPTPPPEEEKFASGFDETQSVDQRKARLRAGLAGTQTSGFGGAMMRAARQSAGPTMLGGG